MSNDRSTEGMSTAEKLDHYTMTEPNTGCWLWLGSISSSGYGKIRIGNNHMSVHRASWERHNGAIPSKMMVCHKCDVRHCINPEHLFLGTAKSNMQDAVTKGRMAIGERNGFSKLTEGQAIGILNDDRPVRVIAKEYKTSEANVRYIKNGQRWGYLQPQRLKAIERAANG